MEAANLSNNEVDIDDIDDIEQKGELEPLDMDTALRWPCTVCELKFISSGVLDKHMNLAHSGAVVGEVEEGTDMDIVVKACTVVGLAKESPRHEEDLFPTTSGHTQVVESEEEENNTAMEEGVKMEKPEAKKPDAKPAPKEESSSEESSSEGEKPKSAAKTVVKSPAAATKEESSSVATKSPVVKTAAKKESSSEDSGSEEEEEMDTEEILTEASIGNSFPSNEQGALILDQEAHPAVLVSAEISAQMKPHQKEGTLFMFNALFKEDKTYGEGCILAQCMGLGKSLQTIALIDSALAHQELNIRKVLILCPASLVTNWKDEFHKWVPNGSYQVLSLKKQGSTNEIQSWNSKGGVLVMNYERYKCLQSSGKMEIEPDIVACDEGHELKNQKIKLYQTLDRIRTKKRIILTGTPIQNNVKEFYNIVNFVKPGILGDQATFNLRFAKPIENGLDKSSSPALVQIMKERLSVLTNLLKKFMNRKDIKTLEPYLKSKRDFVLSVSLDDDQRGLYAKYVQDKATGSTIVDHKKLRNIWNCSGEFVKDAAFDEQRTNQNTYSGSKLSVLFNIVGKCCEYQEKLLVFSESLDSLDVIESGLKTRMSWEEGKDYMRMDGKRMPDLADRKKAVDTFNNENSSQKVFLISSKTGGIGLNLTGATRVVIFDISWNPTVDVQAIYRAYRLGQERPVFIYRLVARGTMEEKIYYRQVKKESLAGHLIDKQLFERCISEEDMDLYDCTNLNQDLEEKPKMSFTPGEDKLLAAVLNNEVDRIWSVHKHDDLLQHQMDEHLSEEEVQQAWQLFQQEEEVKMEKPKAKIFYNHLVKDKIKEDEISIDEVETVHDEEEDISDSDESEPFKNLIDSYLEQERDDREDEEELEQSDEANSNENESIVESIETIKNFLDDEETEDSALEIYPDEDDEEDEDREGQMENKNSLPESQLSRVDTPFHNKMDSLCVSLVQQHLDSIGSTLSDLFRTKYQPEKTDVTMEEVLIKWQDDFQLKNVAGYHSSPLAMPASLLCCLCNDPCCSVEDLRNHLRNTHGVKKEDLGEHIKKTMKEQIKEQESSAEVVTLDEDEDQEEIDVIEIVEVFDEDEDEEDEVSFVGECEGIFMTVEEKEVFRKCFAKKKLLN